MSRARYRPVLGDLASYRESPVRDDRAPPILPPHLPPRCVVTKLRIARAWRMSFLLCRANPICRAGPRWHDSGIQSHRLPQRRRRLDDGGSPMASSRATRQICLCHPRGPAPPTIGRHSHRPAGSTPMILVRGPGGAEKSRAAMRPGDGLRSFFPVVANGWRK